MKETLKKWRSPAATLFCALCYLLCGAIWIYNGLARKNFFHVLCGLVWLAGSLIWFLRAFREVRNLQPSDNHHQTEDQLP